MAQFGLDGRDRVRSDEIECDRMRSNPTRRTRSARWESGSLPPGCGPLLQAEKEAYRPAGRHGWGWGGGGGWGWDWGIWLGMGRWRWVGMGMGDGMEIAEDPILQTSRMPPHPRSNAHQCTHQTPASNARIKRTHQCTHQTHASNVGIKCRRQCRVQL